MPTDFVLGLVLGFGFALLLIGGIAIIRVLSNTDYYGLTHWKLNIRLPFSSMWMNLGYWYY